ncbi:MAG: hypothetical protein WCF24_02115 [Acidimicrobiales bacterium]
MNDFDFLAAEWTVENQRLHRPLSGSAEWDTFPSRATCVRLFDGAVASIIGSVVPTQQRRLVDPLGEQPRRPTAGAGDARFEEGEGRFFGDDLYEERSILARYVWADITDQSARWEQAFSTDSEDSWETNWIMSFTRCP